MRIIFSRKGFDSTSGRIPSPLLPDNTLLSLPIPETDNRHVRELHYSDLKYNGTTYSEIIDSLGQLPDAFCHLDPDLRYDIRKRKEPESSWRALFGQKGSVQSLLSNAGVGKGDIFLFFGLFLEADNNFNYTKPRTKKKHCIWSYFQVDELLDDEKKFKKYAAEHKDAVKHPHAKGWDRRNCIYVAKEKNSLNQKIPGWGLLKNKSIDPNYSVVLTEEGNPCSYWKLPDFFGGERFYINQEIAADGTFRNSGRGQEFVIDTDNCKHREKIIDWVKTLILKNSN
ncbi:MAG: hypothetical protein LBC80_05265 [Treponema sp.]|jgi:hypothetical protein|nr:hypothetical protein [Treponema sp.]